MCWNLGLSWYKLLRSTYLLEFRSQSCWLRYWHHSNPPPPHPGRRDTGWGHELHPAGHLCTPRALRSWAPMWIVSSCPDSPLPSKKLAPCELCSQKRSPKTRTSETRSYKDFLSQLAATPGLAPVTLWPYWSLPLAAKSLALHLWGLHGGGRWVSRVEVVELTAGTLLYRSHLVSADLCPKQALWTSLSALVYMSSSIGFQSCRCVISSNNPSSSCNTAQPSSTIWSARWTLKNIYIHFLPTLCFNKIITAASGYESNWKIKSRSERNSFWILNTATSLFWILQHAYLGSVLREKSVLFMICLLEIGPNRDTQKWTFVYLWCWSWDMHSLPLCMCGIGV